MKNPGEVWARTFGTKSPSRSEALRLSTEPNPHLRAIWCRRFEPGLLQGFSRQGASRQLSRNFLSTTSVCVLVFAFWCLVSLHQDPNGVYSSKWQLTDKYLSWGTLADLRPGGDHSDQCNLSEILHALRISGFTRFLVLPTSLSAKLRWIGTIWSFAHPKDKPGRDRHTYRQTERVR